MPFDRVISPRPTGVVVPAGTRRPPWLQPEHGPVRYAETWVAERGPQLVRAADQRPSGPFLELRQLSRPRA